jgi:hypothetical protein
MKKLLVIVLSAMMVFAFAAVAMADLTATGEIDTGYKSYSPDGGTDVSEPYIFGKVIVNGKLGDAVTGTMVIKSNSDPNVNDPAVADGAIGTEKPENLVNNFQFDEADFSIAQSFGTLKFGYYGWNNNLKDIIDTVRGDVKSNFVASASIKATDNFTVGLAYAFQGTYYSYMIDDAPAGTKVGDDIDAQYGIDLGYAADTFGVDLIYTQKDSDNKTTGIQAYYLINGFKPYIQYESLSTTGEDDFTQDIVGFIYDNPDVPFYGRVEADLSSDSDNKESGVRVGYKLANGVKLEAQNYTNICGTKDSANYFKIIFAF